MWQTQAQQLLDQGIYAEAGRIYREIWDQQHNLFAGSRYLYCLRKAGYAAAAITVARQMLQQHPESEHVRNELVWSIYEAELKPYREAVDLSKILRAANEILTLTPDILPRKLAVFGVIDVAKDKMKWRIVSDWCDKLDPALLDESKREISGRNVISEREQWFFAKLKSLVQLEDWKNAIAVSDSALLLAPRNRDFRRWKAQALVGLGQVEVAIEAFRELAKERNPAWYTLHDLSEALFIKGAFAEAYEAACQAALLTGEDQAKIRLFDLIARLALETENVDVAWRHVCLGQEIRRTQNWRVPQELQTLEQLVKAAADIAHLDLEPMSDFGRLRAACKRDWTAVSQIGLGSPRQALQTKPGASSGVIKKYVSDRGFGFITSDDGTADLFFHITHFRGDIPQIGLRVKFKTVEGKKGLEAVDVQPE